MSFQITALPPEPFAHLFAMADDDLAAHRAVRQVATEQPGFPCRVSLADAAVGDEVVLVNFEHQDCASPYRSAHAVFVRKGVAQAWPAVDEVPDVLKSRTLSLRAFDAAAMLVDADLADGRELGPALDRMLAGPGVAVVHIHYAKPGCYAARAIRA